MGDSKLLSSLRDAFAVCGVDDSAVLSFHHHLRNGDEVLNQVLDVASQRGIRGIHVAASSIFPVHAPLVGHIRRGTVAGISANFISGPVGLAISNGLLPEPAILRTHGGRGRAMQEGTLMIDVAFIAAPAADASGNISGRLGKAACGTMGYAHDDVLHARWVVAVTDCLTEIPPDMIDIPGEAVDFVVVVDDIGCSSGIVSGITRPAEGAEAHEIAARTARAIAATGILQDGFSFQTGAGGLSLAAAAAVGHEMATRGVTGEFISGGIAKGHVDLLRAGLFRQIRDVQCFDLDAVASYRDDPRHLGISATDYAGPGGYATVDNLSVVILGAAELDRDFNVNVTTNGAGRIIGGSGGHTDTAQGARLTVITTRLTAGGFPKLVDRVGLKTTLGTHVDLVVTEAGIAVNPAHDGLAETLQDAGLDVVPIDALIARSAQEAQRQQVPRGTGRALAISEDRNGHAVDVVRLLR